MLCVVRFVDFLNFFTLLSDGLVLCVEFSVEGVKECTCVVALVFESFETSCAVIDGCGHCHCPGDGVVQRWVDVVFNEIILWLSFSVSLGWGSLLMCLMVLWVGSC